jgi:hypothetical protein
MIGLAGLGVAANVAISAAAVVIIWMAGMPVTDLGSLVIPRFPRWVR